LDQAPDASVAESEPGRRGARDELSATGGGEPVEPAGQDRLPVGEGVSRPFVYETPGWPEGGAGTRRRQPGQVRLRRYLVTEVVTETEAGQRHEVRVQSAEAAKVAWLSAEEVAQRMDEAYAMRLLDALRPGPPAVRAHDGLVLLPM
jgi:hypothetical protein